MLSSIFIHRDKDLNPAPITNVKSSKACVKLGEERLQRGDDACLPAAVYLWPPSAGNPGAAVPGTRSGSASSPTDVHGTPITSVHSVWQPEHSILFTRLA